MNEHPADAPSQRRTFVVMAVPASLLGWRVGFDLGAFETVDYRHVFAFWVLSTVALVASLVLDHDDDSVGGWRQVVLVVPSLWLVADLVDMSDGVVVTVLAVLTAVTLPVALYVLARLLAGDVFALDRRLQAWLAVTVLGVTTVGFYVGVGHDRFLYCEDFIRMGDFVPEDCAP